MRDASVGQRIRSVRKGLKITQAQFGRRLGIIPLSVARYEAGRVPRADVLERIARFGGVTTSWLLYGERNSDSVLQTEPVLSERSQRILEVVQPDWTSTPWVRLPARYRKRYEERVKDAVARLKRELQDYRDLLEMKSRAEHVRRASRQ
jgi:transcriptional regulator with XRE-family HTH domain